MKNFVLSCIFISIFSSCATIFGGAKYNATFKVRNAEGASIYYNGRPIRNNSTILIPRKNADKVNIQIEKEGYLTEDFFFRSRKLRGFALLCNIFSITTITTQNGYQYQQFRIPIGFIVDLINSSAMWKPNVNERGIIKENYDKYIYDIEYKGTPKNPPKPKVVIKEVPVKEKDGFSTTTEKLRDLKKMKDEGVITEEEFVHMKKQILGMETTTPEKKEEVEPTNTPSVEKEETKETEKVEPTVKEKETSENIEKEKEVEQEEPEEKSQELKDLDKMLEFGIINEKEYQEMKEKLSKK